MTRVLDASLLVARELGARQARSRRERLTEWVEDDESFMLPPLVYYEVESGLRKAVTTGRIRPDQLAIASPS